MAFCSAENASPRIFGPGSWSILWASEALRHSAKRPQVYRIALLYFGCVLFVYLFMRLGAAEIFSHVLRVGWYFALITVIYVAYQMIRASAYWKCVADTAGLVLGYRKDQTFWRSNPIHYIKRTLFWPSQRKYGFCGDGALARSAPRPRPLQNI